MKAIGSFQEFAKADNISPILTYIFALNERTAPTFHF
jgi:hypothetical protein